MLDVIPAEKTIIENAVLDQLGKLLILDERYAFQMERTCKSKLIRFRSLLTLCLSHAERQELCVQKVIVSIFKLWR